MQWYLFNDRDHGLVGVLVKQLIGTPTEFHQGGAIDVDNLCTLASSYMV